MAEPLRSAPDLPLDLPLARLGAELERLPAAEPPADQLAAILRRELGGALDRPSAGKLAPALRTVERRWGPQAAYNLLQRLEVACGWRRPRLALYDHTLHIVGGAQKYGCTLASLLQDKLEVTLIASRPIQRERLEEWYGLDLGGCRLRILPLPYFDQPRAGSIDPARIVSRDLPNPFHAVSRASGNYDFFVNNSMLEMVYPLAPVSVLVCHFPERRPVSYFYVDRYTRLVHNSGYTAGWIEKRWRLPPGLLIYPPIATAAPEPPPAREPLILSVARFDPGGNKQQLRMIRLFGEWRRRFPDRAAGWKLVLAGGSPPTNPYLEAICRTLAERPDPAVELAVNPPASEVGRLYARASIFWHLCGYGQRDPALIEHFGMTTVEAMQNGAVPVVFDGGGQREIVEPGESGYRFRTLAELLEITARLAGDPGLRKALGERARKRGREFGLPVFAARVRSLFDELLAGYALTGDA